MNYRTERHYALDRPIEMPPYAGSHWTTPLVKRVKRRTVSIRDVLLGFAMGIGLCAAIAEWAIGVAS